MILRQGAIYQVIVRAFNEDPDALRSTRQPR